MFFEGKEHVTHFRTGGKTTAPFDAQSRAPQEGITFVHLIKLFSFL